MKKISLIALLGLFLPIVTLASSYEGVQLETPPIQMTDKASLLRGAKSYMTYCLSCHSLQYMRYEQMADGLGFEGDKEKLLQSNGLLPNGAKITDPIKGPMTTEQAKQTFGTVPPDLTLEARVRGIAWIYTYFHSFYKDPSRPTGTNNLLFPDLAMPNIFEALQGAQVPVYLEQEVNIAGEEQPTRVIASLKLEHPGVMTPNQFDQMTTDLVNFLSYASEPNKIERIRIGVWVLVFLFIFLIVAFLLKKEYWKDIH